MKDTMVLNRRQALCGGLIALALWPGGAARPAQIPALRWTLELGLSVQGTYRIVDKAGLTTGTYSFEVRWSGSIDRDDQDWRLTHADCELIDWKAGERPTSRALGWPLVTEDFKDVPVFRFNYVLQDQGLVVLDFGMEGFDIPVNPSREKFPLILPSSARTGKADSSTGYDHSIAKGSNRIQFLEGELADAPLKKTFEWTWRHNQSVLEPDDTITCLQSHHVKATVSFTPVSGQSLDIGRQSPPSDD